MALTTDPSRAADSSRAVCTDDQIKLAKMAEELDAAAEYITILSGLLDEESNTGQTSGAVDPRERADRAALLQVVYNLDKDNPGMGLADALVYISGVFGGVDDQPVLDPLPEPVQHDVEVLDAPEPFYEPEPAEEPEPLGEADEEPQWAVPGLDDEPTLALSIEGDWDAAAYFADQPETVPEFEPEPVAEEEILPEPNLEPEVEPELPQPLTAAQALGDEEAVRSSLPDGPDDTTWDPSSYVPLPDQDKELDELLRQVETSRDGELYGIRAFAQAHPELLQEPTRSVPKPGPPPGAKSQRKR